MRHIGHPDMTVVLYAKGSVHVLQMLSMLHNALQSTVSCALGPPLFEGNEIPLVRTLISASVLTWKGLQAHGVLQQEPKDKACIQGHLLKGQNRMMQCSCLVLHHVLPFPGNRRTSKAYISICHAGSQQHVTFPATLAAQLYQNTNLVSQQLSKPSLLVISSVTTTETNVGHVSWFQPSLSSHVLCSCCLNQIQRLN